MDEPPNNEYMFDDYYDDNPGNRINSSNSGSIAEPQRTFSGRDDHGDNHHHPHSDDQRMNISSGSGVLGGITSSNRRCEHDDSNSNNTNNASLYSSIPDESLSAVLQFAGKHQYRYIGCVNRRFREAYLNSSWEDSSGAVPDETTEASSTSIREALASPQRVKILLDDDQLNGTVRLRLCLLAAKFGLLQTLPYLRQEHACHWDYRTCVQAALNGHLTVLKWARSNGCAWNAYVCLSAAENGHLAVLQWARNNGCVWNAHVCLSAAENGHLEVLQWARNNGCSWNEWTCSGAADNGHLEVLKWARSNGCPWFERTRDWARSNLPSDEFALLDSV